MSARDGAVAVGPELDRVLARPFERTGAEVVGETQDAERGAQRLVRVRATMHLLAQHGGGRRADGLGPLEQALVVQLDDGAVGQVGGQLAKIKGCRSPSRP